DDRIELLVVHERLDDPVAMDSAQGGGTARRIRFLGVLAGPESDQHRARAQHPAVRRAENSFSVDVHGARPFGENMRDEAVLVASEKRGDRRVCNWTWERGTTLIVPRKEGPRCRSEQGLRLRSAPGSGDPAPRGGRTCSRRGTVSG